MHRLLLRAELRRRGRSWLAVALIGGLAGAFVLITAAGARRSASSYTRFRTSTRSPDLVFRPAPDADPALVEELRHTRGVVAVVGISYFPVAPDRPGVRPFENAGSFAGFGTQFGVDVYRYRVLAGRRANEHRADEVTVNSELAELAHLRVGDRIRLKAAIDIGRPRATVVGIHRGEFDVGPNATGASMLLTAAFAQRYGAAFAAASPDFRPAYMVRVDHQDAGAYARAKAKTAQLYGSSAGSFGPNTVADGIRVQAVALAVLALVSGLATVLAMTQAASRLVLAGGEDRVAWTALGMTTWRRLVAASEPALVTGAAAAVLAVGLAGGLSGVLPTGLARLVEPTPGVRLDPLVLGLGALGLFAIPVAAAVGSARRHVRYRLARAPRWIGRLAPSPPAAVGLRAATVGLSPRSRVQARTAIVAVAAGVAGLSAVAVFATSQSHLFETPEVHGFTWDLSLRPPPDRLAGLRQAATSSRSVDGLAQVQFSALAADGHPLEAFVLDPIRGNVHPTLLAGRPPAAVDEIALPPSSVLPHISLGRAIAVTGPAGSRRMRVVGRAVFPGVGPQGDFDNAASLTRAGAARLGLETQPSDTTLLVHLAPGASDKALIRAAGPETEIVRSFLPPALTNLHRAGNAPTVLALFLAALGAAGLLHALFVAVRMGARDLGVLRVVGFTRRQARSVLTWHASATVVAGTVIGVPIGIALGRWAWASVTTRLGVLDRSIVPPVELLAVAVGAVGLSLAAAVAFGQRAGRIPPARVLRVE